MPTKRSSHEGHRAVEILPLIDASSLRRSKESSRASEHSQDSNPRHNQGASSRHSSESTRSRSTSVRSIVYRDAEGNIEKEVRFGPKGEAEIVCDKASSPASSRSASASSSRSSGEQSKTLEYKHRGTSRERVVKAVYTDVNGRTRTILYN
jgi:hypothetical protein